MDGRATNSPSESMIYVGRITANSGQVPLDSSSPLRKAMGTGSATRRLRGGSPIVGCSSGNLRRHRRFSEWAAGWRPRNPTQLSGFSEDSTRWAADSRCMESRPPQVGGYCAQLRPVGWGSPESPHSTQNQKDGGPAHQGILSRLSEDSTHSTTDP